jgi:DNA-binding response OmpR family regulator
VKEILVVDDSSTMRQLMRMVLTKHLHCHVTEAPDGVAALEQLRGNAFDLVVTDVNMPRLDGLGLITAIRRELSSAVPIIVVTTKGSEGDRERGLELGANTYLTKPINGAAVAAAVAQVLAA